MSQTNPDGQLEELEGKVGELEDGLARLGRRIRDRFGDPESGIGSIERQVSEANDRGELAIDQIESLSGEVDELRSMVDTLMSDTGIDQLRRQAYLQGRRNEFAGDLGAAAIGALFVAGGYALLFFQAGPVFGWLGIVLGIVFAVIAARRNFRRTGYWV